MKGKDLIKALFLIIFASVLFVSEAFAYLPDYYLGKHNYIEKYSEYGYSSFWIAKNNYHNNSLYFRFYKKVNNGKAVENGIGIHVVQFSSSEYAIQSITDFELESASNTYPPIEGSLTGKLIGERNFIQGDCVFTNTDNLHTDEDDPIDVLTKSNTLYTIVGNTVIAIWNELEYVEESGVLLKYAEMEALAEKVVEVLEAPKCKIEIEPHKWNVNWIHAQPEGFLNVFIGNLDDDLSVKDIDIDSIRLNGEVKVSKKVSYSKRRGFDGKVVHFKFGLSDSFNSLFAVEAGSSTREVCIEGKMKDGTYFIGRCAVEILGKEKKEGKK